MLTDKQISYLKSELLNQLDQLTLNIDNEGEVVESANARERELSMYDNHPADMGTELFERERDMALSVHAESELVKVKQALEAIDSGKYGKCETCGKDIPYERLEAIPNTTFCVEHSPEQILPSDRPVEEEILDPAVDNSFAGRDKSSPVRHYRDSFQEVAKFGTSETPSDFEGDFNDYDQLYQDELKDGFTEEYETFIGNDIEGKDTKIFMSEEKMEYEERLDEEGIEAPFGDVPYKLTDGYVDDEES
ncbi:TraR/DksA C4-type zinc finger protein [Lederbergia citrea]|uniref:TraR/DksA C4-type zinc finger protein n=1 Tax=Lederbergia citrea TaxID=2833581 RepID=A0A942Z4X3_9BACI|nr:TraR/DksA C4-type zinc finger protein [Lederbergia citrea]MBS4175920.1 TraR/DksA C4-type zinc finger protein [Lederbergia citrea]MBS4202478.1 TraR/DksA C4-type zinc finger protein [Lederbergia citrea]MBS4222852.1 TraR/DksA C4-type zinc finger protein [Lederbergia citrea]